MFYIIHTIIYSKGENSSLQYCQVPFSFKIHSGGAGIKKADSEAAPLTLDFLTTITIIHTRPTDENSLESFNSILDQRIF